MNTPTQKSSLHDADRDGDPSVSAATSTALHTPESLAAAIRVLQARDLADMAFFAQGTDAITARVEIINRLNQHAQLAALNKELVEALEAHGARMANAMSNVAIFGGSLGEADEKKFGNWLRELQAVLSGSHEQARSVLAKARA